VPDVTNDGLTGLAQDALQLYSYDNSGRQRVTLFCVRFCFNDVFRHSVN